MQAIELTRAQRRRLEETGAELDRVCASDRRFFERRPERQHRIRRASRVEIEHREIIAGGSAPPFGMAVFVAVRNVTPGFRLRSHFIAGADADTDLPEDLAQTIFDAVSSHDPEMVARIKEAYENE